MFEYKKKARKQNSSHAGVGFLLGKIAGKSKVGYPHVSVFVEEDIGRFEISINDISAMHVFQTEYNFGGVKLHLRFVEDPVLTEMVMEISAVH